MPLFIGVKFSSGAVDNVFILLNYYDNQLANMNKKTTKKGHNISMA